MKNIIFISLAAAIALYANVDKDRSALVAEYKNMFEKIGEQRVGIQESEIHKVKSPFLKVVKKDPDGKPKVVVKRVPLILEAIFNKSARINGKWYKLHQSVEDAKIISINSRGVTVQGRTFKERLTLRSNNDNISIK